MSQVDKLSLESQDQAPTDHEDNKFLNAVLTNDREVLKEIYDRFLPRIIHFIKSNSGTQEDAMDIFQDAIMVIHKKAKTEGLNINKSFYNYLYTICRNLWMRELEKKKKAGVTSIDLHIDTYSVTEDITGLNELIVQRETYKLYLDKFKELGEDCQNILQQFFEGINMKTIALRMGFASEGYAKKRKHICQKRLIDSIKKDPRYKTLKHDH